MYTIYDHISPSGKHYIGQTGQTVEARWGKDGSGYKRKYKDGTYTQPIFAYAIEKYGWNSFEHKVLFTNLTKLDADMIEQDLIYYYKKKGLSYNVTPGGEGGSFKRFTKEELQEHEREYYRANKERLDAKKKAYREANKEHIRARTKAYNKAYEDAHKEELKERRAIYRETHREQIRAYQREYWKRKTAKVAV